MRIGISLQSSGALVMMNGVGFSGKMVKGVGGQCSLGNELQKDVHRL